MVILLDKYLKEIGILEFRKVDFDVNGRRDFQARLDLNEQTNTLDFGCFVAIENTEFGGIIIKKEVDTSTKELILSGMTWRGLLDKHILMPDGAQNLKVSGRLDKGITGLINKTDLSNYFVAAINYQEVNITLDRHASLMKSLEKIAKETNKKVVISYRKEKATEKGYVQIDVQDINDFSSLFELSQDNKLEFKIIQNRGGVNHLICLGKGELADRDIVHLYVDDDGSISQHSKAYHGIDEIAEVYDNNGEEHEALIERGIEKLKELQSKDSFEMNIAELQSDVNLNIGDIIGGRDYNTNISIKKPLVNKIYTEENGVKRIDYKVEGES